MTHDAKNFEVDARRDIAQEEEDDVEDVTEHSLSLVRPPIFPTTHIFIEPDSKNN